MVSYKRKVYIVKRDQFCGDHSLYFLESRFSGGSAFTAKKNECIEVMWSDNLAKFVSIPE